jgi:membrane protease YdiL (CAAX protease family)
MSFVMEHPVDLDRPVEVTQLTRRQVYGTWAAAAQPKGVLAWLVAPLVARGLDGPDPLIRALLVCLTAGLLWQVVLTFGLVAREQGSLRWSVLREALWLRSPVSPTTGRVGGRLWWLLVPLTFGFALEEVMPSPPAVDGRHLGVFLESGAAERLFHGSWGWFALVVVMTVANTVLGEELLFRGYLLPRMREAFGRADWVANGVLFATYHLHMPWAIPTALFDTLFISGPSRRYRSAWIGIAVHSAQTVVILAAVLLLVL